MSTASDSKGSLPPGLAEVQGIVVSIKAGKEREFWFDLATDKPQPASFVVLDDADKIFTKAAVLIAEAYADRIKIIVTHNIGQERVRGVRKA